MLVSYPHHPRPSFNSVMDISSPVSLSLEPRFFFARPRRRVTTASEEQELLSTPNRIPSIRSTPSDLWQLVGDQPIAPIGSERKLRASTPPPPSLELRRPLSPPNLLPTPPPISFREILAESRRKNRYAPRMMSFFNPQRDHAPLQFWMEVQTPTPVRWNFQRELGPQLRSRYYCNQALEGKSKKDYIVNSSRHCPECRREPLHKRLMIIQHQRQQFQVEVVHDSEDPVMDIVNDAYGGGGSGVSAWPFRMFDSPVIRDVRELDDEEEAQVLRTLRDHDDDTIMLLQTPLIRDLDDFDATEEQAKVARRDSEDIIMPGTPLLRDLDDFDEEMF